MSVIFSELMNAEWRLPWPQKLVCLHGCLSAASPGATKSSLLSAPSIASMFVPAPEEFTEEQPTVMADK
jgi:hypothetical protein